MGFSIWIFVFGFSRCNGLINTKEKGFWNNNLFLALEIQTFNFFWTNKRAALLFELQSTGLWTKYDHFRVMCAAIRADAGKWQIIAEIPWHKRRRRRWWLLLFTWHCDTHLLPMIIIRWWWCGAGGQFQLWNLHLRRS